MVSKPDFDPDFASTADWAAMYRRCGFQVVPGFMPGEAKSGSWKRPVLPEWHMFQNELTSDERFAQWYGERGEHVRRTNLGAITGKCSRNLMVIDLDTYKKPEAAAWWSNLIETENNGIDLDTVEQRTGGGGQQKFFQAPPDWRVPTNRTAIGVDIRGQGGYVVLPPSKHESGAEYQWLPGRSPDEIPVELAPAWLLDAVLELVEAFGREGAAGERTTRTASPEADLNAFGSRQDGREAFMTQVVWHTVLELYRRAPIRPGAGDEAAASTSGYLTYERDVTTRIPGVEKRAGLEQEGRGPTLWSHKWRREMRRWGSARMQAEAAKPNPNAGDGDFDPGEFEQQAHQSEEQAKTGTGAATGYERLHLGQIKAMPDPKWLVKGFIAERALGFIYGPPGTLKTFLGLDIGMTLAGDLKQWWGRDIDHGGVVIYVSSEGQADIKPRVMAWEKHRGIGVADTSFWLIRENVNFMSGEDIGKLQATIQGAIDDDAKAMNRQAKVAAIFVDTVSRVIPGADENLQKDMSRFVLACDLVRQRFDCVVIGIHHTARAGNFRGSTVMEGAADFIIEVQREPHEMCGMLRAVKMKAAICFDQPFLVKQIYIGDVGGHSSLVLDATAEAPQGSGMPSWEVCREILTFIDEQWQAARPLAASTNTPRSAARQLVRKWRMDRERAVALLDDWTNNGIIMEDGHPSNIRIRGYRKLKDLQR